MPGPNIVNLSLMIGGRYFGLSGAMAALGGLLIIPLVIVLLMSAAYAHYSDYPAVSGALRGMGSVAAGLIIATGIKLSSSLKFSPLGIPLCIVIGSICFACIALLRWPLAFVLPGLGSLTFILAYWKQKL
jgi:chromate transporter